MCMCVVLPNICTQTIHQKAEKLETFNVSMCAHMSHTRSNHIIALFPRMSRSLTTDTICRCKTPLMISQAVPLWICWHTAQFCGSMTIMSRNFHTAQFCGSMTIMSRNFPAQCTRVCK